jgi:hypothetical protein
MARFCRVCAALASVAAVFGCSYTPSPNPAPPTVTKATEGSTAATTRAAWDKTEPPSSCSVTRPGPDSTPPSSIDASLEPVPWANYWFGNASVWTRLPKTGVVPALRVEAGLSTKFPWWRLQPGNLAVTGRLKTAQGTFTAGFPSSGYGSTGFIPSELTFSSDGCWEVRASNENSQPLVFVIWVQESP